MTSSKSKEPSEWWIKLLTTTVKELGTTKTLVLFIMFVIVVYASPDQRKQMIDRWILLDNSSHIYCVFIVAGIILVSLTVFVFYRSMLARANSEIQRIGDEKSSLQEALLKKAGVTVKSKQKK